MLSCDGGQNVRLLSMSPKSGAYEASNGDDPSEGSDDPEDNFPGANVQVNHSYVF